MPYALKEALNAFRRAPGLTLLSALMIALSLLVIGLFGLVTSNIQSGLDELESRVEIVAFLKDDANYEAVRVAQQDIDQQPEVRESATSRAHRHWRSHARNCRNSARCSADWSVIRCPHRSRFLCIRASAGPKWSNVWPIASAPIPLSSR
jgi:hypothetical protein